MKTGFLKRFYQFSLKQNCFEKLCDIAITFLHSSIGAKFMLFTINKNYYYLLRKHLKLVAYLPLLSYATANFANTAFFQFFFIVSTVAILLQSVSFYSVLECLWVCYFFCFLFRFVFVFTSSVCCHFFTWLLLDFHHNFHIFRLTFLPHYKCHDLI